MSIRWRGLQLVALLIALFNICFADFDVPFCVFLVRLLQIEVSLPIVFVPTILVV
jgi:hypothetical protein